jgi:cation:H+ antiporter
MLDYLALLLGVVLAGAGGELFVRGTVGLAHWLRVAPGIIGATVAAFSTSSPELSVAVMSATAGEPEISFGDALGSNVVNIALILGIALMFGELRAHRVAIRRDFSVALAVPLAIGILAVDGEVSRIDAAILILGFVAWLTIVTIEARRQRSATEDVLGAHSGTASIVQCVVGLGLLIAAGRFIVIGAKGIASQFGVGEFVIGAVVVAVGTSVPELATTVIAKLRGHDEVGLGTILGSNIFNGMFIVAVAAMIHPIQVDAHAVATALVFGLITTAATHPINTDILTRRRGALLLVLYVFYVGITLQTDGSAAHAPAPAL